MLLLCILLTDSQRDGIIDNTKEIYMPLTPKQMIKLLEDNGFEKIRHDGSSHIFMKNNSTGKTTTVPMHNKDLPKGLEQAILKQAGIKK